MNESISQAPMTAEQINRPQMGQVSVAPGAGPDGAAKIISTPAGEQASPAVGAKRYLSLSLKLPRAQMIEAVKSARDMPAVYRGVLLAEIEAIPSKHDLLRLDFVRHAHGEGANWAGSVKEL